MGLRLTTVTLVRQSHVYGHAGSAEDKQQDGYLHDARSVPRRPQDQGGVPQSRTFQVSGQHNCTLI